MSFEDVVGLAKLVRALNPQFDSSEVMAELQRGGMVLGHDGLPLTPDYVARALVFNHENILRNRERRRERLAAARELGRHSRSEWLDMIAVFKGLCVRCRRRRPVTQDHIVPLYRGGSDAIGNIQPLCRPCNSASANVDFRDKARTAWTPEKIRELRASVGESVEVFGKRFGRSGRTVEDWEQGRRRPDVMVLLSMQRMARHRIENE